MMTAVLYCAQEDMGGKVPKQGASLEIATREGGRFFQKYYVVASTSHMGMLHVEVEAMAQGVRTASAGRRGYTLAGANTLAPPTAAALPEYSCPWLVRRRWIVPPGCWLAWRAVWRRRCAAP